MSILNLNQKLSIQEAQQVQVRCLVGYSELSIFFSLQIKIEMPSDIRINGGDVVRLGPKLWAVRGFLISDNRHTTGKE